MPEPEQDLLSRVEALERLFNLHLGPQPGATSLNRPHNGVPYFNSDHLINVDELPVGTASDEVAAGDHTHAVEETIWGYYL